MGNNQPSSPRFIETPLLRAILNLSLSDWRDFHQSALARDVRLSQRSYSQYDTSNTLEGLKVRFCRKKDRVVVHIQPEGLKNLDGDINKESRRSSTEKWTNVNIGIQGNKRLSNNNYNIINNNEQNVNRQFQKRQSSRLSRNLSLVPQEEGNFLHTEEGLDLRLANIRQIKLLLLPILGNVGSDDLDKYLCSETYIDAVYCIATFILFSFVSEHEKEEEDELLNNNNNNNKMHRKLKIKIRACLSIIIRKEIHKEMEMNQDTNNEFSIGEEQIKQKDSRISVSRLMKDVNTYLEKTAVLGIKLKTKKSDNPDDEGLLITKEKLVMIICQLFFYLNKFFSFIVPHVDDVIEWVFKIYDELNVRLLGPNLIVDYLIGEIENNSDSDNENGKEKERTSIIDKENRKRNRMKTEHEFIRLLISPNKNWLLRLESVELLWEAQWESFKEYAVSHSTEDGMMKIDYVVDWVGKNTSFKISVFLNRLVLPIFPLTEDLSSSDECISLRNFMIIGAVVISIFSVAGYSSPREANGNPTISGLQLNFIKKLLARCHNNYNCYIESDRSITSRNSAVQCTNQDPQFSISKDSLLWEWDTFLENVHSSIKGNMSLNHITEDLINP